MSFQSPTGGGGFSESGEKGSFRSTPDFDMKEESDLVSPNPNLESGEGISFTPLFGENIDDDNPNESNSFKESNWHLTPVPRNESGEGLPYAPVDWPNPGDIWSWKVGKRVASTGYYHDRYLYPPKHLQKGRVVLGSKASVEQFLQSEFPGADVNAFFASFCWKIPSTTHSWPEGEKDTEYTEMEQNKDDTRPGQKKRKKKGGMAVVAVSKRQTRQSNKDKGTNSEIKEESDDQDSLPQLTLEEFDEYLNSLENLINQPLIDAASSPTKALTYVAPEEEMADLRANLNARLAMGFTSLVSSEDIVELKNLAAKIRKDPSLTVEQLIKLKLIEEIPLISDVFLEAKGIQKQADKFFEDLGANKTQVASLKTQYVDLKEETTQLQAQVDSSTLIIQDIDEQIARLQAQRAELVSHVEANTKKKDELTSDRKTVASSVQLVVRKIQLANSKMQEWEAKKKYAVEREAEIIDRFAPLEGFSL